jgi:hypothetical protein
LEVARWQKLDLEICTSRRSLTLTSRVKAAYLGAKAEELVFSTKLQTDPVLQSNSSLIIGSSDHSPLSSRSLPPNKCFNGKIDTFTIASNGRNPMTAISLDFSIGISTDTITDISTNRLHGFLVNAPARATPGHDWNGYENDWTKAKYGYGAIHFHDDDLDDAAWDTDFSIALPENLPSGAYAVLVDDGVSHDYVTFFVSPRPATKNKVAFVLSTFTYLG